MFFDKDKLLARIREIKSCRFTHALSIPYFYVEEDEAGENGTRPKTEVDKSKKMYLFDRWCGRDSYLFLHQEVTLPCKKEGFSLFGRFDFGKTSEGNSAGFESLLYINQVPVHGVDSNHEDIFITDQYLNQTVRLDFRLWSGLEGGGQKVTQEHQIKRAEFSYLHDLTDQYYYRLKTIYETILLLDENDPSYQGLISAVNSSLREIDWREKGNPSFYEGVKKANDDLVAALQQLKKPSDVTVHALGHTHIDVAWLWQLKHTREKTARSFSTVLSLMEQYPEYTFLQTQPQLYKYLKADYPDLYLRIKEKVKSGQWEVGGGMWLEADCNIPSGESIVRQLLFGYHFLKEEFNVESKYLWLPDVFGYSWCLPQILKLSGIETFMTTKISWSQYNRMPHDTFYWRGIDGSEILTHFITTPDSGDWWYYTYNGDMSPKAVKGMWDNYRNKSINKSLLLAYGYGDGGGGVNRDMLETKRAIKEMPSLPHVTSVRADDYFTELQETVKKTDQYVHTWDGELYLEYHRGTYTSQAEVKKRNRQLEYLLKYTEWRSCLLAVMQSDFSHYQKEKINQAWEIVLRNQFHDIIPGTSIKEVYDDARKEYDQAFNHLQSVNEILDDAHAPYVIFNDYAANRSGLINIPKKALSEEIKSSFTHQIEGDVATLYAENIPSLGYQTLNHARSTRPEKKTVFSYEADTLVSPFYKIVWNEKGEISELFDLEHQKKVLKTGESGNVFTVFEDKPVRYDAWDIDLYYQEKHYEIEHVSGPKVINEGPLKMTLQVKMRYQNSVINQNITVYRYSRRIDFKTEVDWQQSQELLKVSFPVNIRSTEATYDIQFGNVKRPTHWNTSWDYARFETVAHKWADLSERNYGVALLNDSKYGYDIKDHVMRLTLIKSGIHPDPSQDRGNHLFTYSLLPHAGDFVEGRVEEEANDLNQPLVCARATMPKDQYSLLSLSSRNIIVDAVKKGETKDVLIIRMHEYTGSQDAVVLTPGFKYSSCHVVDLMERPIEKITTGEEMTLEFTPYEIKTLAFTL